MNDFKKGKEKEKSPCPLAKMTPTVAYMLKESLCVAFYNHPTIVIFISNESLYIRVYIYFIRVGAGSGGSVCCQRKEF